MKLLTKYINGNYKVFLFNDGTKYRSTLKKEDKEFHPYFPENIDVKVTNKCNIGCPFCHENSLEDGKSFDTKTWAKFVNSLRPGMELAIGGGGLSSLSKPEFFYLLTSCAIGDENPLENIIPSMTVNQMELENNKDFLMNIEFALEKNWLYGLGISFVKESPLLEELASKYPDNIVIHTINGTTSPRSYQYLAEKHFKVLVLGYKDFRRGHDYKELVGDIITKNQKWLSDNILELAEQFNTVSFDNLAIEQLNMKEKISSEDWDKYYMGDEGSHTMYVDLVAGTFAMNSTTPEENRHPLPSYHYDISDLFRVIQEDRKELDAGITN